MSRLEQHNTSDRSTYTSKHRPWLLKKQVELGEGRGLAMRLERVVKRMKSRKLLEYIIEYVENMDQLAQLVSVPTCRDLLRRALRG